MDYQLASTFLDSAEDSIIITEGHPLRGEGPKIIYVNQAFVSLMGYTKEEIIGKTPRILQGEETSTEERQRIYEALSEQKYVRSEIVNYTKSGVKMWMELSISPILDKDKVVKYFVSIQKNITKRKEEEQLLKDTLTKLKHKVAMLDQINLSAAHDFKEPIRSIHSFTQLLERKLPDSVRGDVGEYLGYIQSGAERLDAYINGLYAYSFTSSVQAIRETSLESVVNDAILNLQTKIGQVKAVVKVTGTATIVGDPSQLSRLFQNLIDNGIKYAGPDRAPIIQITILQEDDYIEVFIKDNGRGVAPQDQEKIFNLFYRDPSSKTGGQGIGLAICRKIVTEHNGTLELHESSPDGTVFRMEFSRI